MRKRLVGVLAATGMAVTSGGFLPAPAQAATTYVHVYLVAPDWGGWCPDPPRLNNYITHLRYVVAGVSQGGDSGDDIVYAKVKLNQSNTVTLAATCKWTTPQGATVKIKPTRNKQTFWIRANSTYKSN